MVIFVPPGAKRDKTRNPGFYEGVSRYLTDLGVPQGLGRLAEFSRLAPFSFFAFAFQSLGMHLADVPQVTLDAAVTFEQLPSRGMYLCHDRVVLLVGTGFSSHRFAPSGLWVCR